MSTVKSIELWQMDIGDIKQNWQDMPRLTETNLQGCAYDLKPFLRQYGRLHEEVLEYNERAAQNFYFGTHYQKTFVYVTPTFSLSEHSAGRVQNFLTQFAHSIDKGEYSPFPEVLAVIYSQNTGLLNIICVGYTSLAHLIQQKNWIANRIASTGCMQAVSLWCKTTDELGMIPLDPSLDMAFLASKNNSEQGIVKVLLTNWVKSTDF